MATSTSPTLPVELLFLGLFLPLILFVAALLKPWRPLSSKGRQELEKLPLPPGRFGLPFIGETMAYLATHPQGQPWRFFDERIARFGETFKTSLLMSPTVVLGSPLGNKAAFSNIYTSWPASLVSVIGRDSLLAQVGERAARTREALAMFLRPESLQRYTGRAGVIAAEFMKEHLDGQRRVLLFPLMKKLLFSVSCQVLVGQSHREDQDRLLLPFNIMVKGLLQIPINIPGTRYNKALAASETIRKQLQVWIDERRTGLDAHQDVLSHLLRYTDERGEPFSDKEIKNNIMALLLAGRDSSASALTMACKYLASNPDIMDEVYRENKEIAESKAADEPLKWGDLQKMKLSWRVVQESMRLMPPVQASFRVAPHEMSFNGFRIPKSWKIMWSPYSTHRNPKYFREPEKFDPSRFEGAGPAPFTFVPFGGGPRMCPGNEFARMAILLILHHLVTRFSWTLEDPNELIAVDPVPLPSLGLPIQLTPRIV